MGMKGLGYIKTVFVVMTDVQSDSVTRVCLRSMVSDGCMSGG